MKSIVSSEIRYEGLIHRVMSDYKTIHEIERDNGSSFYVLDINKLRDNYKKINTAFKSRYDNFIIGYSYKTNYLPYLCKEMKKLGAFSEVVSRLEYDLAIKIGEDPKRIIFNGPLKTRDDIYWALKNESIINIDLIEELEYVKEFSLKNEDKQIKIGLRINIDTLENGKNPLVGGYQISRFGICVENGDMNYVLKEIQSLSNIQIVGLHCHYCTSKRSVESYRKKTQILCDIAKKYILADLEYIDIGGGIYGEVPKSLINEHVPTFEDYAEAVCKIMNNAFGSLAKKPMLILEPGISMVANAFMFVSKVMGTKRILDKNFVLVDGSVHNIKPSMHKKNFPMRLVKKDEKSEKVKGTYNIVGYTCMERDYIGYDVFGEIPDKGDYFIFENVGAYTIVLNPPFIKERPAIIAVDNNEIIIARNKETIKQFFNEELYFF